MRFAKTDVTRNQTRTRPLMKALGVTQFTILHLQPQEGRESDLQDGWTFRTAMTLSMTS